MATKKSQEKSMSTDFLPVNLPSGCITYKAEEQDITVRPYNGGDEIILAQINPINLERNFASVLKNVVKGIDPLKLTTGDQLYLIIWEYITSYSDTIKLTEMCSHCLQSVDFIVNLKKDMNIAFLSKEYAEPKEITLPVSKRVVTLRLLTVADSVEVEKMAVKGKNTHLYKLARSIVDCDDPFLEMERMRKWSAKDVARVRKFHELDTFHGPTSTAKVLCPKCKEEEEVVVPFRLDFFYPTGDALGDCFRTRVSTV